MIIITITIIIFGTIQIISQFQARYSGITQEQFMLILNLI